MTGLRITGIEEDRERPGYGWAQWEDGSASPARLDTIRRAYEEQQAEEQSRRTAEARMGTTEVVDPATVAQRPAAPRAVADVAPRMGTTEVIPPTAIAQPVREVQQPGWLQGGTQQPPVPEKPLTEGQQRWFSLRLLFP